MRELDEIDFGTWTGRSFEELDARDDWQRFNEMRSVTRAPDGESMLDVQSRALRAVETIRLRHPAGMCAVVSHGDVLRSLVAHLAGIPLELCQRLEISPASVSVVRIGEREINILRVNDIDRLV
jgi:broad specificity phosphatase PhoE